MTVLGNLVVLRCYSKLQGNRCDSHREQAAKRSLRILSMMDRLPDEQAVCIRLIQSTVERRWYDDIQVFLSVSETTLVNGTVVVHHDSFEWQR